uniref:VP2 n=1 Tax=Macrostomum lignano TaxID=282301 RepID=A0A1I8I3R9_9PLAT
ILQPVASSVGATSAVTAALEQTGELTALRTMNARLAEENRQLRQRLTSLWPSPGFSAAGRLADSADAAAASIAAGVVSIAQQFIGVQLFGRLRRP